MTPENRGRLRGSQWEWVEPRIKRRVGSAISPIEELYAATLSSSGRASHRGAAWLHELDGFDDLVVELSVPRGSGYRRHLVHHVSDLVDADLCEVRGVPCTTATRTIIDLGSVVPPDAVWRAFESAVRKGLTSPDYLRRRLDTLSRRGRRGVDAARRAVARHLGPTDSELERLYLELSDKYRLPIPVLHLPVGNYEVDIAYPDRKLVVELDGYAHHSDRDAFGRDRARQNWLVLHGWTILRFTWEDLTQRPRRVAETVLQALAA